MMHLKITSPGRPDAGYECTRYTVGKPREDGLVKVSFWAGKEYDYAHVEPETDSITIKNEAGVVIDSYFGETADS